MRIKNTRNFNFSRKFHVLNLKNFKLNFRFFPFPFLGYYLRYPRVFVGQCWFYWVFDERSWKFLLFFSRPFSELFPKELMWNKICHFLRMKSNIEFSEKFYVTNIFAIVVYISIFFIPNSVFRLFHSIKSERHHLCRIRLFRAQLTSKNWLNSSYRETCG